MNFCTTTKYYPIAMSDKTNRKCFIRFYYTSKLVSLNFTNLFIISS